MICYNCKNQLSDATVYDECPFCGADLRPGAEKTVFPEITKEKKLDNAKGYLKKANNALSFIWFFVLLTIIGSIFLLFFDLTRPFGITGAIASVLLIVAVNSVRNVTNACDSIIDAVTEKDAVAEEKK